MVAALAKFDELSWGHVLHQHEWFRVRQLLGSLDAQSKGIFGVRWEVKEADEVTQHVSFCKPLLPTQARDGELIREPLPALAAARAPSVPRQGEISLLIVLGTWQQGSAKEEEENERREPSPHFPTRGTREPHSCRVL